MDLIQVEGVASLISAKSKEAARAQQRIADGGLSKKLAEIKRGVVSVLSVVENEIDISEELTQKQTFKKITNELKNFSYYLENCAQYAYFLYIPYLTFTE